MAVERAAQNDPSGCRKAAVVKAVKETPAEGAVATGTATPAAAGAAPAAGAKGAAPAAGAKPQKRSNGG